MQKTIFAFTLACAATVALAGAAAARETHSARNPYAARAQADPPAGDYRRPVMSYDRCLTLATQRGDTRLSSRKDFNEFMDECQAGLIPN